MAFGTDNRLTGQRGQWGLSGHAVAATGPEGAGPYTAMDATAQNASRLAVQLSAPRGSYPNAMLSVTSAIESGVWHREVRLYSYGVCIAVPQGRVTASIKNFGAVAFDFRTSFGEGVVSREWQTVDSGVMPAADKQTFLAPPYARRMRASVVSGGPFRLEMALHPGVGPIISLLPAPGGQTDFVSWAPESVKIENLGLTDSTCSVEWEVLA